MAIDREAQIREKAYRLWQTEGEPEGRHDDHWSQAERDHDDEGALPSSTDGDLSPPASTAPAGVDATTPVAVPGGMTAGAETPVPAPKPKAAAKSAATSKVAPAAAATIDKQPTSRRKRST